MTKDEALKLALEALEILKHCSITPGFPDKAITAIKEALAQPEQEQFALKHRIAELEGAVIGLQARLAQPEQEPVAVARVDDLERGGRVRALAMNLSLDAPLYTTPPHRKPLTDEQIRGLADKHLFYQPESYEVSGVFNLARAIEQAHGIKE